MHPPSFPHSSVGRESACNSGNSGLIPGLGRSPGEGNGNPLQYSGLENPMDRGAWRAIVCRVPKSQTQVKRLRTHTVQHRKWKVNVGALHQSSPFRSGQFPHILVWVCLRVFSSMQFSHMRRFMWLPLDSIIFHNSQVMLSVCDEGWEPWLWKLHPICIPLCPALAAPLHPLWMHVSSLNPRDPLWSIRLLPLSQLQPPSPPLHPDPELGSACSLARVLLWPACTDHYFQGWGMKLKIDQTMWQFSAAIFSPVNRMFSIIFFLFCAVLQVRNNLIGMLAYAV